jgi:hypothetical protein
MYVEKIKTSNISREESMTLRSLKANKEIRILQAEVQRKRLALSTGPK